MNHSVSSRSTLAKALGAFVLTSALGSASQYHLHVPDLGLVTVFNGRRSRPQRGMVRNFS